MPSNNRDLGDEFYEDYIGGQLVEEEEEEEGGGEGEAGPAAELDQEEAVAPPSLPPAVSSEIQ